MSSGMAPLTELEAVNEILGTGQESPVSTLEGNEVIDASLARDILRNTSVEVQTRGWFFNTEENVPLEPDQAGTIQIPRNVLKIDATDGTDVVARGLRLYNRVTRSYEFPTTLPVEWVLALPFDELPSSARNYITVRAARRYQARYVGDAQMHQFTQADEEDARQVLNEEEMEAHEANMLNSQFARNLQSRA